MSNRSADSGDTSHYIGQRLSLQSNTCSVRYVGTLPKTIGSWLGVEWDNPEQGKHDGVHNGVRYFTCLSQSPTAGSFVRTTRPRDAPRGFLAAVKEKYTTDAASYFSLPLTPSSDGGRIDYYGLATPSTTRSFSGGTTPIRFGTKVAEEVGFAKVAAQQANLQALRIVVLNGWRVSGLSTEHSGHDAAEEDVAKSVAEILDALPRLGELDLSRSLMESWARVVEICAGLKQLRVLKLGVNRFRDLTIPPMVSPAFAFTGITELSLDGVLIPWDNIARLIEQFPSLTKLSLASNNFTSVSKPFTAPHLKTLGLGFNAFSTLSSLSLLSSLPSLTTLSLQSNALSSLTISPPTTFPQLATLDLSTNNLSSFSALNPLTTASFPALTAVRLSRNPFFTGEPPDTAHMLSLAVLPGLKMLNYSPIDAAERFNAELYYLSRVTAQLRRAEPGSTEEQRILDENPQFQPLVAKHDYELHLRSPRAQEAKYAPGTLGARLITLHVTPVNHARRAKSIQVPKTISIYELKSQLGRRFGLLPARFRIVWETGEWDPVGKGEGEDGDEFSVGSEDGEGDDGNGEKGRWVRREVVVLEGTSSVGFWVDGDTAVLRLEELDVGSNARDDE